MARRALERWALVALLLVPGWRAAAGLECGTGAYTPPAGYLKSTGRLHAVTVFARFQDEAAADPTAPAFADQLFDPQRPGSLTHFYDEMSWGQFHLTGVCLPRWYTAAGPASEYQTRGFGAFARDILRQVDRDVDLGRFDNDGPDGVPNSGDDDGSVDLVFINILTAPPGFIVDQANGIARLGLADDFVSDDRRPGGLGFVRVRADGDPGGVGGTLQQGHTFAAAAGNMAHEFGHVLGLPDLYDTDYGQERDDVRPELDSAGIGYWGLMGHGARGWGDQGGPVPFDAWCLYRLGWLGVTNRTLQVVSDRLDAAPLADVRTGGRVYQLPTGDQSVFYLLEYRRPDHSYYERGLPAAGLLIWRIDEAALGNDDEGDKLVDLECADGRYLDAGYPDGRVALPQTGQDNLDFWAHDDRYRSAHAGNLGDATDPFDGVRFTEFSALTNPAAEHGIRVANIHPEGDGLVADLSVDGRQWAGQIVGRPTWADTVDVVGDVTVAAGAWLTLAPGAVVRFMPDQTHRGADPQRCELVVDGTLTASAGTVPILLTSGAARPAPGDWSGILVGPGGSLNLVGATIEYARQGIAGSGLTSVLNLNQVAVRGSSQCGICVQDAVNSVLLSGVELTGSAGVGGRIETQADAQIHACQVKGNAGPGIEVKAGVVDCRGSTFAGNGDGASGANAGSANLLLGSGTRGTVVDNRITGGVGIRCVDAGEVSIERNELLENRIGVVSANARPWLMRNHFAGSGLVLEVTGFQVPVVVELNAVEEAERLVDNQAASLVARNNWWGRADEAWIAARMQGLVQWRPYLNFDPRRPVDFSLGYAYPNPGDGSVVVDYTVGINVSALGGSVELLVEVRDVAGGLVRRLARQPAAPGIYQARWDGRDEQGIPVASGVYCCWLRVDPIALSRKLVVIR